MGRLPACLVAFVAFGASARADADPGYRGRLVACITASRACDSDALRKSDRDFLRYEPTARTRDPRLAREIADARLSRPVRIDVSERRLDHMHARDVKFEAYRSQVRALRHGWIPGENAPYDQPVEGWADVYENWRGR